jgi:hypothetical protein
MSAIRRYHTRITGLEAEVTAMAARLEAAEAKAASYLESCLESHAYLERADGVACRHFAAIGNEGIVQGATFGDYLDELGPELARLREENAKLEAELAAIRAEAARPIGVGDVVQIDDVDLNSTLCVVVSMPEDDLARVNDGHDEYPIITGSLCRIGRAVRMPDGSPVPPVEGSV